ncbi:MAG: hypothetical protein JXX28_15250 [Deltaproteobacteria bacterium]|nr:hypothetical protein [Deltaproteobacteria bacterium]
MITSILSGSAQIISSGMVTTFGGASLRLTLAHEQEQASLELRFHTVPDHQGVGVSTSQQPDGTHLFDLVNFDTPEGRGTSVPAELGPMLGGVLWVHFRVFRYGNTPDHTVHYTFYLTPS